MKFLCEPCDTLMRFEQVKGPIEGLMHITFVCPKCKNRISMINNPQETQLVRSLGVSIGGKETPPQPLELVRTTLAQKREADAAQEVGDDKGQPIWTEEAEKRLEKVPSFVRGMAKRVIESHAREKGRKEITPEVVDEAKSKWGMG